MDKEDIKKKLLWIAIKDFCAMYKAEYEGLVIENIPYVWVNDAYSSLLYEVLGITDKEQEAIYDKALTYAKDMCKTLCILPKE